MSAAATAAGYLYAHGYRSVYGLDPHRTAEPQPSRRPEPTAVVLEQDQSQPIKQVHTPRIEYRKRRSYALPSAA